MTTLHVTNNFNVQMTLNAWLQTALAAISLPSWMPTIQFKNPNGSNAEQAKYRIVFVMPEEALQCPCFSVFHHDVDLLDVWQGRNVGETAGGMKKYGMMDVSAWVSRGNIHFMAQLATMASMIEHVLINKPSVQVQDWSNPSSPSNVAYLVRIYEVEGASVEKDPNPDIERKRWLVKYYLVSRG